MRQDFLPFSKPSISEEDIAAVGDVLRSGWITTGPNCAKFEDEICEYTSAENAVAIVSATAGMHTVLMALGIGPGDEVITPSLTWVSTVNIITLLGATPVYADVDRDTLLITPESIEKCITPKTRAIIPVHYAGVPVDLDGIYALAEKHDITVIEDAAHAIGTFYKGEHIGQRGIAIYSFHPIKNITTGEGGMVTAPDNDFLNKVRQLKFHGLGVDAFDRNTQGRAPQAEVITPGFKYNMTDISAVLGRRQLAKLEEFNAKRTRLALRYRELLADVPGVLPLGFPENYDFTHAWHLFIVRIDIDGLSRDAFMEKLKEYKIGTGLHFRAAHGQKYYRERNIVAPGGLTNTEWNSDRICSLPLFPDMTFQDQDDVIDAIKQVIKV
jgi:UDP-4-amino-4-deoxy-L-arabinose-oxoglutarate aminotransferase